MADPTHETPEFEDIGKLAALGTEMESITGTEAFQTGVTLAKARIFTDWCDATSEAEQRLLKAEQRALERLLEAFSTIYQDGLVARESIRRVRGQDTPLPE